jgi:peroxiredoxin
MTLTRHIPLVVILTVGCGDVVTLADADGLTTLTYDCDEMQSIARSASDRAVVEDHAMRIARHVDERGDTEFVTRLLSAFDDPDAAVLEGIVVKYVCEHGIAEEPPPAFPEPGTLARDFTLRQLTLEPPHDQGPSVTLSDHRGSLVVLDVFGTWCRPCVDKYPAMAELARDYSREEVRFFGILLNDSPKGAAKWFSEQGGLAYPFLLESGSDIEATWGLHGAPRMFVIDQQGLIVGRCLGCQFGRLSPDSLPVLLDSLLAVEADSRLTSASS